MKVKVWGANGEHCIAIDNGGVFFYSITCWYPYIACLLFLCGVSFAEQGMYQGC